MNLWLFRFTANQINWLTFNSLIPKVISAFYQADANAVAFIFLVIYRSAF